MKPTPQQEKVILSPEGNILVSAAAGSGKTSVMTKRIITRIIEGRTDIRNILVMTFTDAAAKSMRTKIESALKDELEKVTDSDLRRKIYRQISYIPQSNISTIHSFCLEIIKNFYFELTDTQGNLVLEPGFQIADPDEAMMLKVNTLNRIMEERYVAYDEKSVEDKTGFLNDFMKLINSYGNSKSDEPVRQMVLSLYSFLVSMPDYIKWMEKSRLEISQAVEDFTKSRWFMTIKKGLMLRIENAKEGIEDFKNILYSDISLYKTKPKNEEAVNLFTEFIHYMEEMFIFVENEDIKWDEYCDFFKKMPRIPEIRKGKEEESEKREFFELFTKHFTELIYYTTGRFGTDSFTEHFNFEKFYAFSKSSGEIRCDMEEMLPVIDALFEIVKDLDTGFSREKREQNIIDFNDFEHMALKLLNVPVVKNYISEKFHEVYIDEYQDTSSIQDAIVDSFTSENCFMVGDVKQSIYKFRHAKPKIFMDKYREYKKCEEDFSKSGTIFELNTNFRSVEGVLKAVNNVFYQIMSLKAGEIDYNEDQALSYHRKSEDENEKDVKIILTDTDGEFLDLGNNGTKLSAIEKEAINVAGIISDLIINKNIKPGEIAILARTKNVCKTFSDALTQLGIQNEFESQNVFLESYCLKVLDSLLRVIDNPLLDIHIATVMTSPVFDNAFSEEELIAIRISGGGEKYFHECMQTYVKDGEDESIKEKLQKFYEFIDSLREKAVHYSTSEILEEVYSSSGLALYANSVKGGRNNVQDIENFISWIRKVQKGRSLNLHNLIRILDDIKEKTPEKSPFGVEESVADSVKIMTIHKSKGLEFKIVFLVSTHSGFKKISGGDNILFSEELGLSFYYVNYSRQYKYPAMPVYAMREEMKTAALAEEMRLLYVGMTRAMDRLYISAAISTNDISAGKGILQITNRALKYNITKSFPGHFVLSAKSMLEWILISVARNQSAGLHETGITPPGIINTDSSAETLFFGNCWEIKILSSSMKFTRCQENENKTEQAENKSGQKVYEREDKAFEDAVKAKFFRVYPFLKASNTPLKTSVSEIKRRERTLTDESYETQFLRGINITLRQPGENFQNKPDAAQKGIAVHSFFQYADLKRLMKNPCSENIVSQMEEMEKLNIISNEELEFLRGKGKNFENYYKSETAKEIFEIIENNPEDIFMEMPFTLSLNPESFYGEGGFLAEDKIYVQGIIDCWYKTKGSAVLIDYKTDNIQGSNEYIEAQLKKRYKTQLELYKKAIEEIENINVGKCIIWHFGTDRAYILHNEIA